MSVNSVNVLDFLTLIIDTVHFWIESISWVERDHQKCPVNIFDSDKRLIGIVRLSTLANDYPILRHSQPYGEWLDILFEAS